MKSTGRLIYILSGLVLLGTLIFRFRLLHLPIDRDEGEFAYAGWRMLHGGIPYLDYYNMKMPGIYALFASAFFFFGSTVESIRLMLIIANLLNAFFIYRLAGKWKNKRTGVYASTCYLVFSMQVELQGTCSHAEHFAMLFVLPAMLLMMKAMEKKSMRTFFFSGILFGLSFLMKQPAFVFPVMAVIFLFTGSKGEQNRWKFFFSSTGLIGIGFLLPLLLTTFLLIISGAGNNFFLFAFRYAKEYISYLTPADGWHNFAAVMKQASQPNLILWMLVPLSFLLLLLSSPKKPNREIFFFFIFSFLAAAAGFYFRPHYFQFMLPAVSILAGTALGDLESRISLKNNSLSRLQLPVLILLSAITFFVYRERELFSIREDEKFIRKIYGLDFFNATRKAGDFIAANSKPEDKVAIFGAEPEIWFYAKRLAASGYLYVYPLLENQKFAPDMRRQFYTEVIESKPDILIYTSNDGTWYASETVHREMFGWYKAYRDSSFRRIALVDMPYDGPTIYHFTGDTAVHPVNEENYFEICKRK